VDDRVAGTNRCPRSLRPRDCPRCAGRIWSARRRDHGQARAGPQGGGRDWGGSAVAARGRRGTGHDKGWM